MDEEQTVRPIEFMKRLDDIHEVLRNIYDLLDKRLQASDSFQDGILRDVKEIEYTLKSLNNKK